MSVHDHISETALVILSLRVLTRYEKIEKIKIHDTVGEFFLPEDRRKILSNSDSREMIKKSIPKGLYEYVIARTQYFDEIFLNSIQKNFEQIVNLGAGYDSRPFRFAGRIADIRIFELDREPTQSHKVAVLQKNGIVIPENILFVPVDLQKEDFISLLIKHGYDPLKKALFIWEGVTFYLSKNTVTAMLQTIKDHSAPRSRICLDFQTIQREQDLIDTGLEAEKIQFSIESGKITDFVNDNQYKVIEHLSSSDIEKRFLTLESGELFGSIAPIMNFLLIEHS